MLNLNRRQQIIILFILGALLFGGGIKYGRNSGQPASETVVLNKESTAGAQNTPESAPLPAENPSIIVHVQGAVEKQGVYQLPAEARIYSLLDQAVPLPEADLQGINLAQVLLDGQPVYVPYLGESEATEQKPISASGHGVTGSAAKEEANKINLNTASVQELADGIPGIGPALAQRIVDYRENKGGFRSIEDLKNVSGIGEKRFSQMQDYIRVY